MTAVLDKLPSKDGKGLFVRAYKQVKMLDRIREKRGRVRFSRGTAAAVREAGRLAEDLRMGAVTREDLLNSGRAFATVDDWLKSMA